MDAQLKQQILVATMTKQSGKKTLVVLTNSLPQEMLHRGALIFDMWRLSMDTANSQTTTTEEQDAATNAGITRASSG